MRSLSEKEFTDNKLLKTNAQPAVEGVNFWNELITTGAFMLITALTVTGIGLMLYVGIVSLPLVIVWSIGFPLGASLVFSGAKNLYLEGGDGKSLFFFSAGFIALCALFGSILGTFIAPGPGTISGMAIGVAFGAIIAPLVVAAHSTYRYFFPKKESEREADNFESKVQMADLGSKIEPDEALSNEIVLEKNHSYSIFNNKTEGSEILLDNQSDSLNDEKNNGCIMI